MMSLVELVLALKPLLQSPQAQFKAIVRLLETNVGLAEFEVARFMVSQALREPIELKLGSADPGERAEAVTSVGLLYARAPAASILRRAVKDPDKGVRAAAVRAVKRLRLTDVSPPDTRFTARQTKRPWNRGGWNPSGWLFGLAPAAHRRSKTKPTGGPALPALKTRADVAALVGVAPEALPNFMRAGVGPGSGYVEFERPKRRGGTRRIAAPRAPLRKVQRALLDKLLSLVPTHDAAHGFVRARSILTNARPHVGAAVVVKIDLEDFFPTLHFRRVQGLFESLGYQRVVAATLAGLTTYRPLLASGEVAWPGVLPQGAPTSPAISNLCCRRLDARLAALAKRYGGVYTRYADDLTLSFAQTPENLGRVLWWVNCICQQEGFFENAKKRSIMRRGGRQSVTGLTVNQKVTLARDDRRRFKAILNNCKRHGLESQARGRDNFRGWLEGYAAFAHMVQPELGAKWLAEIAKL